MNSSKKNKKDETTKPILFRTQRGLRDKLMKRAALDVLNGQVSIGPGGAYSINHSVTKILAEALGVDWKRAPYIKDTDNKAIGMTFVVPEVIKQKLKQHAAENGTSVNDALQRILEKAVS